MPSGRGGIATAGLLASPARDRTCSCCASQAPMDLDLLHPPSSYLPALQPRRSQGWPDHATPSASTRADSLSPPIARFALASLGLSAASTAASFLLRQTHIYLNEYFIICPSTAPDAGSLFQHLLKTKHAIDDRGAELFQFGEETGGLPAVPTEYHTRYKPSDCFPADNSNGSSIDMMSRPQLS